MSEGSEARSRLANHEAGAVEATDDEARKEKLAKEAAWSSGTGADNDDDEKDEEDENEDDEEEDDWPRRKRRNSASSSHVK